VNASLNPNKSHSNVAQPLRQKLTHIVPRVPSKCEAHFRKISVVARENSSVRSWRIMHPAAYWFQT